MRFKVLLSAAAVSASLVAFAPSGASAQNYGGYGGPVYPDYGRPDRRYYAPRYDDERSEAWRAHERWEQRRAREQRERWERQEARRSRWQRERDEHRDERYGDDGD